MLDPDRTDDEVVLLTSFPHSIDNTMEDESPDNQDATSSLRGFTFCFAVSQGLGLTAIILVAVWCGSYLNGFGWTANPKMEFNFHPLFMVIGMVFLYAEGIMVYRVLRNERKKTLKLAHFSFQALCLMFTAISLKAVFDSHNLNTPPIPNLYSAHSWMGICTVALFCCQLIGGFISFLYPGLRTSMKESYLPLHTTFGLIIFIMAIATCLMGITEKAFFSMPKGEYGRLPPQAIVVNLLVIVLVLFGAIVVFLVGNSKYRRIPLPEDEISLLARRPIE